HRLPGQNLDLTGEIPVVSTSFPEGNGWKEIKFDAPATGRYVCIEADNAHDGQTRAAIAEMYLLNQDGERISREPWTVAYADSEDVKNVNRSADKVFDLQESTYWSTNKKDPFPHYIVLDLGKEHTLTALQYLPRMESNAPSAIKDFKVYVSSTPFKF
ncbi:MAG: discoidin domain-containing protein, partial [Muribaculaceae bacterium]|nr:discoidin domain-containing protein [Muribaculaceae bacterium]